MSATTVTATEMAKEANVSPKMFRAVLRRQHFRWHTRDARWTVERDSYEHEEMRQVLQSLIDKRRGLLADGKFIATPHIRDLLLRRSDSEADVQLPND